MRSRRQQQTEGLAGVPPMTRSERILRGESTLARAQQLCRQMFALIPSPWRCKFCNAPFSGRNEGSNAPARLVARCFGGGVAFLVLAGCGGGGGEDEMRRDVAPGRAAQFSAPLDDVVVAGDGVLYISSCGSGQVFKLEPGGELEVVAGTGELRFSGDAPRRATTVSLDCPAGLALDEADDIYFAEHGGNRVRKIDRNGVLTTFVGRGPGGIGDGDFAGDGGSAKSARLQEPVGLAFDRTGNLYIGDRDNNRVRKVDVAGVITTFAGTGEFGFGRDGAPAVQTAIASPTEVAVSPEGAVYFIDAGSNSIRKVDPSGVVATIAGHDGSGFGGDGDPASAAQLNRPSGITVAPDGTTYIGDCDNNRVRKIDRRGIITTIVGTGEREFAGDGGPATRATLTCPTGVALDIAGNLYIADANNLRVRKVGQDGVIMTIAGG